MRMCKFVCFYKEKQVNFWIFIIQDKKAMFEGYNGYFQYFYNISN